MLTFILAFIASSRGWGFLPWLILGGTYLMGFAIGATLPVNAPIPEWLWLVDIGVLVVLASMALAGNPGRRPVRRHPGAAEEPTW